MITNMSTLTLTDKAATPVNHVFSPASRVADNTARWLDKEHNSGVAIGYSGVTFSVKEPVAAGGVYRQKVSLSVPKLDLTVPAVPKLLGTARFNGEFIFPDIMSDQDRKDIVRMVETLFAQGSTTALGDNFVTQALPY